MLRRRVEFSFERGPCDREIDRSWIHVSFHFPVLHFVKQTLPKTNRSFHCVAFCAEFLLRDAVRCGARSAEQSERSLILSRK